MTITAEGERGMVGRLADVMDEADVEYSIRLTRLVDGEATYTLTTSLRDGPLEFPSNEDASNYVQGLRRQAKVRAVLLALRSDATASRDFVRHIDAILDRSERTEGEN